MKHPAAHIQLPDRITVNDELELRLLNPEESLELFALVDAHRDHLRTWLPWVDANREVRDSLAFIAATREEFARKTALTLAITVKRSTAGVISLRSLDWVNRGAEIGYWLAKTFEGQGIMLRCCHAVLSHAFGQLGLHRVVIRCAQGNTRSCAIPEKLGFMREGLAREAEWLNGAFVDLNVYSLLSSEWKNK